MKLSFIAVFGLLGVFARYGVGVVASKIMGSPFPYGTFFVNISGAFLIGMIFVLGVERALIPEDLRVGIMVGFLGGYTTFSSYCLEAFLIAGASRLWMAAFYLFFSPCLGLLATFGGVLFARLLMGSI